MHVIELMLRNGLCVFFLTRYGKAKSVHAVFANWIGCVRREEREVKEAEQNARCATEGGLWPVYSSEMIF